jgi:F1F0 ATPase subunit 2
MQSISLFHLLFACLFGGVLGIAYFALLWLTVKYLARVRWPAIWVMLSLLLRMGGMLVGLYWIAGSGWIMLVAAMLGIIVVRVLFTRYLRPEETGKGKIGYGN